MLNTPLEEFRRKASKDIRCNVSAPQALTCFMLSDNFESAVRNGVYIDGDTDTTASIAGALAEAYYGVASIPPYMIAAAKQRLTLEMIQLVNDFYQKRASMDPNYQPFSI